MKIFIFRETEISNLNPLSIQSRGMGATDTSVVCLAQELGENHKVVVCCPTDSHKKYTGVEYIPFRSYGQVYINIEVFNPDVLIVAGNPNILFQFSFHVKRIIFWQQNHPDEMIRFPIKKLFDSNIDVVFPSPEAAEFGKNYYKADNIYGIYNGIRDIFFIEREKIHNKIVYCGALTRAKGLYNLLSVVAGLSEYQIYICGGFDMYNWIDVEYQKICMPLIERNPHTFLLGTLNPGELAEHIATAELCICNPMMGNKETCCVSALEAMATGTPVISGGNSLIDSIISHGGISYREDLLREIKNLMGNRKKRGDLSISGKSWSKSLKWKDISKKWSELWDVLVVENQRK